LSTFEEPRDKRIDQRVRMAIQLLIGQLANYKPQEIFSMKMYGRQLLEILQIMCARTSR